MDDYDIYNDLIMEHGLSSPNKKKIETDIHMLGHNPNCGDEIEVFVKLDKKKNIIEDISFMGHGCAISVGSTSIMIEILRGKDIDYAKKVINIFFKLIKREELSKEEIDMLDEAYAFKNVSNMPQRVKCALLSWHTLEELLNKIS